MWPFGKKNQSVALPPVLYFKSGEAFLSYQCEYGHTDLKEGRGVVALVLDAKEKFGTESAVKIEPDGRQMAILHVAGKNGGFIVPAMTPSGRGDHLESGDVVIWVPGIYNADIAKGFGDTRAGWVGLIRAKVAPEIDTVSDNFRVICEYA